MNFFSRQKTVSQVAKLYPNQRSLIKITLFKAWIETLYPNFDYRAVMSEEQSRMTTHIGQVIEYLFAEDPSGYGDGDVSHEQRQLIDKARENMPEKAYEVMMKNDQMRKIVVYTLRIQFYLNTMIKGATWLQTDEGQRVNNIMQQYGGEFTEEVTDRMFDKLVTQTINEAKSLKIM
jgi:hypothetical protein